MIILVVFFFALTLYFSQNQSRVRSKISNSRRNCSYILAVVAVSQLLLCKYGVQHFFIGVFVGIWALYTYTVRKSGTTSWKGICKTFLLILSSFTYLASVNLPMHWEPVAIQATILIVILVLQRNLRRLTFTSKGPDMNATNVHKDNSEKSIGLFSNVSKRTKRSMSIRPGIIYWIAGVIIFVIVLPFIIFIVGKAVDGYMDYFYSVQNIGKVEEVDSCMIDTCLTTEDVPISEIIYYRSDADVEVYPTNEYYTPSDTCAE